MKALEKKRGDYVKGQSDPTKRGGGVLRYQVAYYAVSLTLYGWFLGWITYDLFAWHKTIFQVSLTNYVGAITAMFLLYAGTKLFHESSQVFVEKPQKHKPVGDTELNKRRRQSLERAQPASPQPSRVQSSRPLPTTRQTLRNADVKNVPVAPTKTPPTPVEITVPGCGHHFGYLSQPRQSRDFPDECLMCGKLIECGRATR